MALNWQHIKGVYGNGETDYYTYVEWSTASDVAPVLYFSSGTNYNTRAEIISRAALMGSMILSNINNNYDGINSYYGNVNYYNSINILHIDEDNSQSALITISSPNSSQVSINKSTGYTGSGPTVVFNVDVQTSNTLKANYSIFGSDATKQLIIKPDEDKIISSMPIAVRTNTTITGSGSKITSEYIEAPYFNATSDIRAKTNINPFNTSAIDIVKSLNTYTYTYKDSGLISYGIMAQDVQALKINDFTFINNPDASGENGDYMSIKEDKLVYLLLEAVKEQQKQIDKLEKEIEVLRHE